MRKKVIEVLKQIIIYLSKVDNQNKIHTNNYTPLSPINDVKDSTYCDALGWAISTREENNIRNIALTGPYGSGKSSILNTFKKSNEYSSLNFLNISLATFKEVDDDKDEETLRLIELGILQQLIYHVKPNEIPDSKLKLISSISKWKKYLQTISISIYLISIAQIASVKLDWFIIQNSLFFDNKIQFLYNVSIIYFLLFSFILIAKSILFFKTIKTFKLNIQNNQIEISKEVNNSLLNQYIDEIIYFFEKSKVNVVIIEDLDRFKKTEIFTKLREINYLLNISAKTKKNAIVFIYAVRDEIFSNKERTKFFDFIVPVIPIINSSNSNSKLFDYNDLKNKSTLNLGLTDNFINDVSFYIDDMRLLHNIINEYLIYKKSLNNTKQIVKNDQLFAIIIYKNILSKDFSLLEKNDGDLFKILNSKSTIIEDEKTKHLEEIENHKEHLSQIKLENLNNIKELRKVYLFEVISTLVSPQYFSLNNQHVSFEQVLNDNMFEALINDQLLYKSNNYNPIGLPQKFKIIEGKTSDNSYKKREELIAQKSEKVTESIKNSIETLKSKIFSLENKSIYELNFDTIELKNITESKYKNLLYVLLKNSYITEDYIEYTSLFHEGEITRDDNTFITNVKSKIKTPYDHNLNKITKTIQKINDKDFLTIYCFNNNLLKFILSNENYKLKKKNLLLKLSDESDESVKFIDQFMVSMEFNNEFIKEICKYWHNIWEYNLKTSTKEKLTSLLYLILNNASINDIIAISKISRLNPSIETDSSFFNKVVDENRQKEIIQSLNIKFSEELVLTDKINATYIYENNHYKLRIQMIKKIIDIFGSYNVSESKKLTHSYILNSSCDKLISYINEEIDDYMDNVFLLINHEEINEPESMIIPLLNNKEIDISNQIEIITRLNYKISTIDEIELEDVIESLFNENKIKPSWESIIRSYSINNHNISEGVLNYLNNIDNVTILSESFSSEVNKESLKILLEDFWYDILINESISETSFKLIIKSNNKIYEDISLEDISLSRIIIIIKNDNLEFSFETYNQLKELKGDPHLIFLDKVDKNTLIENSDAFELAELEMNHILNSSHFSSREKINIANGIDFSVISQNKNMSNLLINLLLTYEHINFDIISIQDLICSKFIDNGRKINLFNSRINKVVNFNIANIFFESLGNPYNDILKKNKNPLIENNKSNKKLLDNILEAKLISSFSKRTNGYRVYKKNEND